ncbi:C2 domain-containing protein [Artemisia annua]|uniref:C2 domain-containing protein n=1 Tax=Artemisia annua TaxID=35608 RepID=A0A2U1KNR9_ARTAN|nr:C2 domain-containing protein [Artemisia annua]
MTTGGVLEVTLVDSEGIRDEKFLGCVVCCGTSAVNRPYVCIEYGDQKRGSKVAVALEKKASQKLVFRVMDKHKLSDDAYVGEATIYVKHVVSLGMEEGEAELGSRKYRVVREDKTYTGDVSVAVIFKRKEGGIKASLLNNEKLAVA